MSGQKKQKGHYFSDPRLLSRVRQYVKYANASRKPVVASVMADDLQNQFSEYSRKKKNAFTKSVEKAYTVVLKETDVDNTNQLEDQHLRKRQKTSTNNQSLPEFDGDGDSSDSDASFSSNPDNYVSYEDRNGMNSMMTSLYQKSPRSVPSKDNSNSKLSSPWYDSSSQTSKKDSAISFCDQIDLTGSPSSFVSKEDEGNTNQSGLPEEMDADGDSPAFFIDRVGSKGSNSTPNDKSQHHNKPGADAGDLNDQKSKKKRTKEGSARKVIKKRKKKDDDSGDENQGKKSKGPEVQISSATFADFGGNEECLMEVCKLLVHMKHPEVYQQLGVTPPRGFLLHGPPGCGKTLLANAIAGELGLPFIKIAATEVVSGVSGESEEKIRDLFDKAVTSAPCIVFIDEIDAISPKRETASKDMERRIVAQLLTCMDDLGSKTDSHVLVIGATNRPDSIDPALRRAGRFDREICLGIPDEKARKRILLVLCRELKLTENFDFDFLAKNSPGYVGADLMSLAREASMTAVNRVFQKLQASDGIPGTSSQNTVSKVVPSDISKEGQTDISIIGQTDISTTGQTEPSKEGETDISKERQTEISKEEQTDVSMEICTNESTNDTTAKRDTQKEIHAELETVLSWLKEHPPLSPQQMENLYITMEDFMEALKYVQPSAKREGFATIPDVSWDDIGALHTVREDLQLAILAPVKHSEAFSELGLNRAQGILLAGPPGCGKTLLAKAVANESGINFISVKGPELLNMYVGESERAVRQVFQRARNSSPCVIFFDELDALCPRRTDGGEGGSSVRVVNQLLTEMDGLEERKQVFIMGATNRPDIIDPAVLRPGRLDKTIYVGLPNSSDRLDILMTITKKGTKPKLEEDVNLEDVANDPRCQRYTGADLAALVREASVCALKTIINSTADNKPSLIVTKQHFELAFTRVRPSVSTKDQAKYEKLKESLSSE
ncbi:nuclear valosin-containing protein-like isoform X2 [Pecten maximus]|uniref:nuclear valosin-containing protein-like isoform X1 n=1 Tax=Pecten maximus TaxID=6579 RepID=UPI001458E358|nr:nuclear valosin-containing protein-like isoform X1 [Pecten maximus]XP_033734395.1 nuclear valosin-containing protein-like isoform X2 [Pecten maximus]